MISLPDSFGDVVANNQLKKLSIYLLNFYDIMRNSQRITAEKERF